MSESTTTVCDAFQEVPNTNVTETEDGMVTVIVGDPDTDFGKFAGAMREIGLEPTNRSRRINGELVARVPVE